MIRVLIYVAIIFLVAAGAAWLADRPGDIVLNWQGYEVRTSLLIAAIAVVVLMVAIAILWSLLRALFRAPYSLRSHLGRRRRDRGYRALNAGIIAVGAGDARAAREAADESRAILGPEPLVLLLSAQAAQLAGDGDAARTAFQALTQRPDTRLLGLHGLFVEAERHDQYEAARHFAEEAATATPRVAWAGTAMFDYAARDGDWKAAIEALDANLAAGLVEESEMPQMRAALMTARAMELEAGDPDRARLLAIDALTLDPGLAPAAVLAARLYTRRGDLRRASRVLEGAWKVKPNPEIADAYATVRPGDSVLDRLKRMRKLSDVRANHPEGSMAIARAAIDAGDWDAAREALDGLSKAPTERVCLLMAEIEDRESNDQGRVRAWLTRALSAPRDPVWVADGQVLDHWMPMSPVTGKVGGVAWAIPPAKPRQPLALDVSPFDMPVGSVDPLDTPRLEHRIALLEDDDTAEDSESDAAPEAEVIEATPVVAPPPPQPPMPGPTGAIPSVRSDTRTEAPAAPPPPVPPPAPAPEKAAALAPAAKPDAPTPAKTETPRAETAKVETAKAEAPKSEPAKAEPPKEAKAGAPKLEPGKAEPPKVEASKVAAAKTPESPAAPLAPEKPAVVPSSSSPKVPMAVTPASATPAVRDAEAVDEPERPEEPVVPHAPDDPGPLPPEPEEEPVRRRFRLF